MSRRLSADPVGQVESARLSGVLFRAHPPGRVRGRLRLTMRRNDQGNDHQDRGGRKYEDHGGDAHEDPVLACLPLPLLQRDPGSGRTIARGRIVEVDPLRLRGPPR